LISISTHCFFHFKILKIVCAVFLETMRIAISYCVPNKNMKDIRQIKVFLASPSDVSEEGYIVRETLESVSRTLGEDKGFKFVVINWKTDGFPEYGSDAQSILNEQIADMTQYDLFIGIMWNRFGTPTPRAGSGTEEEFLRAADSYKNNGSPHIMFYFNQAPYSFDSPEDAEQKKKVLELKKQIEKEGLPFTYNGKDDFQSFFRNHIESWLIKQSPQKLETPHIETKISVRDKILSTPGISELSDSGMWILLKTGFYLADEVNELGNSKILIKIPVNTAEQDALLRTLL
jgi:hypothetical protein